jgi:NitT/TauT family transport system substrate-binding protein
MAWRSLALSSLALLLAAGCVPAAKPPATSSDPPVAATAGLVPATLPPSAGAVPGAPPAAVTVRYGGQPLASDVGLYLAIDHGYFQQEGIDLELVPFAAGSEIVPALATNQVDAAGLGPNPAFWNAVARGLDFKAVLDRSSFRPGHGATALVVRKTVYDAGRGHRLDDLRGLTMAISPPGKGTTSVAALAPAMQRVGASVDDLTIQPLAFPDMVPALAHGSVDAALLAEPFLTRAIRDGTIAKVMGQDEMYPYLTVGILAFSPGLYADRPLAKRFVRAYLRAIRAYSLALAGRPAEINRAQVDEVIARYTRVDIATVRDMVPPGFSPNGLPNLESLLYCYRFFREQGLVPDAVSEATLASVWGFDIVDEVLADLGRLPER